VPGPDRVEDWHEVLAVAAALRTGLVEAFAYPSPPGAAAARLGLDERAVGTVAGALEHFGYLRDDGGRLALTSRGRALLGPAGDGRDPAAEIMLTERAIAAHLRLAEVLRTGRPVDDVSRAPAEEQARFMRAMRDAAHPRIPATLAAVGPPPREGGRLLDAGGAPGSYARAFAGAGWRVTVLDLPESLAITRPELVAGGIEVVEGDMTETLPEGPWNCIYLGNVTHLFGPEEVRALLRRAAASLVPGGLLAVQDIVRGRSLQAERFAVLMLLVTEGGRTYGEDEYRAWMGAAGCPVERIVDVEEAWHQLLLGRKAA
jgi:SAM-dependent methyltransferase